MENTQYIILQMFSLPSWSKKRKWISGSELLFPWIEKIQKDLPGQLLPFSPKWKTLEILYSKHFTTSLIEKRNSKRKILLRLRIQINHKAMEDLQL